MRAAADGRHPTAMPMRPATCLSPPDRRAAGSSPSAPVAALAHAVLIELRPPDGASVAEPPVQIRAPLQRARVARSPCACSTGRARGSGCHRRAPNGDSLSSGRATPLAAGGYFLSYRVTLAGRPRGRRHAALRRRRAGPGDAGTDGRPAGSIAAGWCRGVPLAGLSHGARRRGRRAVRRAGSAAGVLAVGRTARSPPRLAAAGARGPGAPPRRRRPRSRPACRSVAGHRPALGHRRRHLARPGLGACRPGLVGASRLRPWSAGLDAGHGIGRRGCRELRPHRPCRLRRAAPAHGAGPWPACAVRRLLGRLAPAAAAGACVLPHGQAAAGAAPLLPLSPWSRSRCSSSPVPILAWVQLDGDAGGLWQTAYGQRLLVEARPRRRAIWRWRW